MVMLYNFGHGSAHRHVIAEPESREAQAGQEPDNAAILEKRSNGRHL